MEKRYLYAVEPFKWRRTPHGDWNEHTYPAGTPVEIIGSSCRGYDVRIVENGIEMYETGLMQWSDTPINTETITDNRFAE